MRALSDEAGIRRFMERLAREVAAPARVYFTGGATAVLMGWRPTTIDVDIRIEPERDELLRALQPIKDELQINIELASPADFIPVPSGWENRSPFLATVRKLSYFHFDLYAQALAKVERGHSQDTADVGVMLERRLIERERAIEYFDRIEPDLYRFPAIDAQSFREAVSLTFGQL